MSAHELHNAYHGVAAAGRRDCKRGLLQKGCLLHDFDAIAYDSLEIWRASSPKQLAEMAEKCLPCVVDAKMHFYCGHVPLTLESLERLAKEYRGIIEVYNSQHCENSTGACRDS